MPQSFNNTGKSRRSLSNLLIYPEFQLPLILLNAVIIGLCLIVFWIAAQSAIHDLQPAAPLSGAEVNFFRKYLEYQTTRFHTMFLLASAFAFTFSTAVTLYMSHRIAGPMVSLRTYFRAIKEGADPLPQLFFRDRDFLSDIPPLVNDAIAALVERLTTRRRERA